MIYRLYGNRHGADAYLRGCLHMGDAASGDQADPGKQPGRLARLCWQPGRVLLAVGQRHCQFGRLGRYRHLGPDRHRRPDHGILSRSSTDPQNFGAHRERRGRQWPLAHSSLESRPYRPPETSVKVPDSDTATE